MASWNDEVEFVGSKGILFLLAWQMIAVQKACQCPCGGSRNPSRRPAS